MRRGHPVPGWEPDRRGGALQPGGAAGAGALQVQAASYAKAAGGKVAGRAGAAKAKIGGAIHDRVPGMRVRVSNGRPANGQGNYAQTPGTADGPPGD
jgi:hypothetical protein